MFSSCPRKRVLVVLLSLYPYQVTYLFSESHLGIFLSLVSGKDSVLSPVLVLCVLSDIKFECVCIKMLVLFACI